MGELAKKTRWENIISNLHVSLQSTLRSTIRERTYDTARYRARGPLLRARGSFSGDPNEGVGQGYTEGFVVISRGIRYLAVQLHRRFVILGGSKGLQCKISLKQGPL